MKKDGYEQKERERDRKEDERREGMNTNI